MADDTARSMPDEILLVPPPVRPRRLPFALPPADLTMPEPWVATDALSTPAPHLIRPGSTRDDPRPDIAVPDTTDECYQPPHLQEPVDDPDSLGSSNTVPLFGLAPERTSRPTLSAAVSTSRERSPRWPWVVLTIVLALGLALTIALIAL